MINIQNTPAYAWDYEFIVVRQIDDDYWFYGAYEDGFKASQIACEIHGLIVHNVRIQGKKS